MQTGRWHAHQHCDMDSLFKHHKVNGSTYSILFGVVVLFVALIVAASRISINKVY